jgi:hypothetical protein
MTIAELDQDFWFHGLWLFALGAVSPWLTMLDTDKYAKYVDRVQNLDITTIASCHSPVIEGPFIERAHAGQVDRRAVGRNRVHATEHAHTLDRSFRAHHERIVSRRLCSFAARSRS